MRPHHAHWPVRVPHAIQVPETSLWDNLATSARRFPNKVALEFLGQAIRYGELSRQVEALAARLHQWGVAHGDRVLLDMQNCPQLVVAHFAILRANAVVVPINPMNRAEELKHYITDSDARVALVTSDLAADMARASNELPAGAGLTHLVVTHYTDAFDPAQAGELPASWASWLLARPEQPTLTGGQVCAWVDALACNAPPPSHEVGANDLALLPYTSGTTGQPKGCMHPHRTIMHNVLAGSLWSLGSHENIALCVVPMFHITGIVVLLHTCMYLGATMVVMPRWDRELAGRLISKHRVTHWTNIPTMVIDLLGSPNFDRFDLSSLQYIGGGGAGMPQAVAQRLLDLYGLHYVEGYGLTEGGVISVNPADRIKPGSIGTLLPGIEVKIADDGELLARSTANFDGYYKDPAATTAIFRDGWLATGDIAECDADGYYYITGRKKELIVSSNGKKIYPAQIGRGHV